MSQKTAAVARTSMAARLPPIRYRGIGPLIASAMVAAIGNGAAFARAVTLPPGRLGAEAVCRLAGLVPKQIVDRRSDDPRAHQQAR
jgi:hypothetical protein